MRSVCIAVVVLAIYATSATAVDCDVNLPPTTTFAADFVAAVNTTTSNITVCLKSGGQYSGCATHGSSLAVNNGGNFYSVSVVGDGATLTCANETVAFANTVSAAVDAGVSDITINGAHGKYATAIHWTSPGALTLSLVSVFGGHTTAIYLENTQGSVLDSVSVVGVVCTSCTGGALYVGEATVTVTNCVFTNNSASSGAGIAISFSTVDVSQSVMKYNEVNVLGGAISAKHSIVTTSNNTITHNEAEQHYYVSAGGAISSTFDVWISTDDVISDNSAPANGGAVFSVSDVSLRFNNAVFENNHCNYVGGAVNAQVTNVTLSGCTFNNNTAGSLGGAVYYAGTSAVPIVLEVENCAFTSNSGTGEGAQGGALYVEASKAFFMNGCTVRSNYASSGGALQLEHATGTVSNVTFNSNSAYSSGAVAVTIKSTLTMSGCDVSNNQAHASAGVTVAPDCVASVSATSVTNNTAVEDGGGFYLHPNSLLTTVDTCVAYNKGALGSGGYVDEATWVMSNSTTITDNVVSSPGGKVTGTVSATDWCGASV